MTNLLRYLILLFFISTESYSCALCQMAIPKVSVETQLFALPNKTHFEIVWKFNKEFMSQIPQFSPNEHGEFDQDAQDAIAQSLENYLDMYNYLTKITYTKIGSHSDKFMHIKPLSKKTIFKDGTIYFKFNFDEDFVLSEEHVLTILSYDALKNFNFLAKDTSLHQYSNKYHITTMEHYAQIFLNNPSSKNAQIITKNIEKNSTKEKKQMTQQPTDYFYKQLSKQFENYKEKIKTLLNDIKQNNSVSSYFWLLFFSFIYGVLHAIGPGHGKSLVASYFLSENHSVVKAFNISLLIGVVHTFSAFLLTVFIYLVLNLLFASFLTDVSLVATKLSAIIIIVIASYLIYKKYKEYKASKKISFSLHNPNAPSCGCSGCRTKSEDLGIILAAGIVPCPGTVTIFIFTFGLGIYFVGFLSAIFMSLGMSLIIFITAYMSIHVRKKSSSNLLLQKVFEYGSLVFILALGLFLLWV